MSLLPPHKMDSQNDKHRLEQIFKEHKVPVELQKIIEPFLVQPVPPRNNKDHTEHLNFKCHATLFSLTKKLKGKLPAELDTSMSDIYRGGMMAMCWIMLPFVEDLDERADYLRLLKEMSEIEFILNRQSATKRLADLKGETIKGDFTPEEMIKHLNTLSNIEKGLKE